MPKPSPLIYLPLWERALTAEIGIAVKFTGMKRHYFANILYDCRKQSADPRLQDLILFQPAGGHEDEVWICKKQVELDD